MKKIFINGRFLTQSVTGVNRFAIEICNALLELQYDFTVVVPEWLEVGNHEKYKLLRYGRLHSHLWEQVDLYSFMRGRKNAFLISFSGLGPLFVREQIFTIHDLSFFRNPKWFSLSYRLFYRLTTPIIAKRSRGIITVSEFSKKEIIELLSVPPERISVVPNAISSSVIGELITYDVPNVPANKRYILAVSSLDPRKNHGRLIEAFLDKIFEEYQLLLVGKTNSNFNLKLDLDEKSNVRFLGYVSDIHLAYLYKNAELFIYPSLYEGFGIPPLEAMKNGCPVIVSDIESLREVCGDAALYVNPQEISEIKKGIQKLLTDQELKNELIIKGKAKASEYDWKTSASKVVNLIRSIS